MSKLYAGKMWIVTANKTIRIYNGPNEEHAKMIFDDLANYDSALALVELEYDDYEKGERVFVKSWAYEFGKDDPKGADAITLD